jgi:hypothetical protein
MEVDTDLSCTSLINAVIGKVDFQVTGKAATLIGKVSTSRSSGTDAIAEPLLPAPFR